MKEVLPTDCKRIIIVGAGGFGREVLQWARHAWPQHVSKIAGFLSADPDKLEGHAPTLPILGSPADFKPQPSDGLVLAIGVPGVRRQVAEQLEANGGKFLTLIHPTAIIAGSAVVGRGAVVCPFAVVCDSATTGRFVLLNLHASLGHDAVARNFAILSPYATLGGYAKVEDDVFMGLHASLGPGAIAGARSKISANSVLLVRAPNDSIVFGVPGSVLPRVGIANR